MEKVRLPYMRNFQSSFIFPGMLLFLITFSCHVNAGGNAKQQVKLSGMFATDLSKNGEVEITTNQEYCSSNKRPLRLNQEMNEILAHAIQYSQRINIKSECQKVATEKEYQSCRFYFYSPNKNEQWSTGFTFLGNPNNGQIKIDSIQCFSTP